ncbi:hypothetical protein [Planktothrix agardhii]|uniref:hypothetical protein n=1 Tax=Planktothrix agardhii TaxID=1160 RepID=UPI001F21BCAF|nr:hypothetical protein [Planktothrix agardhii]MCF3578551.1 hypothetical protein [Planktothrix agardhii 1812]MCF3583314.1 hypothetical protein [Planktothrix agardhii 1811]
MTKNKTLKNTIIWLIMRKIYWRLFSLSLTLLLSGCNFIEGIFSYGQEKEFSLPKIDLSPKYCGDNLENISSYPTKIYPVFFDVGNYPSDSSKYRGEIQEFIKSNFCENVRRGYASDFFEVLVLGYFLDKNQAEELKNTVGHYLSDVKVGTSYEMKVAPSELRDLAKLNEAQVQEILSMDKNNYRNQTFKPIVPTYVPEGYQIAKFSLMDDRRWGPSYGILYKNNNNFCFSIGGSSGGWGDGPRDYQPVEVISPALGKVILEYTDNHRDRTQSSLVTSVYGGVLGSQQAYGLGSGPPRRVGDKECRSISIQEAVKIVESLQYLNP